MRVSCLAFALPLLIAACVSPPRAPPPTRSRPVPITPRPAPLALAWEDRAAAVGAWSYAGRTASFEDAGQLLFSLRCDPASRTVIAVRVGRNAAAMSLRATTGGRTYLASSGVDGTTTLIAANDRQLDALAFSRGKIMVSVGTDDLVLPAWPEMARVVEDCRT